ncbi:hypothetical protein NBRC116493_31380 [Aurantivibrio infirmus]
MSDSIVGVVIAGGKGLRMGGCEKTLLKINDKAILSYIADTASPQLDKFLLNSNSDPDIFSDFQIDIIRDKPNIAATPLLGIYSTLDWLNQNNITYDWLMSFPGDCPFFPEDIVARLRAQLHVEPKAEICSVLHNQQIQPLFSLWSPSIVKPLKKYIEAGSYSIQGFIKSRPHSTLKLSDSEFNGGSSGIQKKNWENYFININTIEELKNAQS